MYFQYTTKGHHARSLTWKDGIMGGSFVFCARAIFVQKLEGCTFTLFISESQDGASTCKIQKKCKWQVLFNCDLSLYKLILSSNLVA